MGNIRQPYAIVTQGDIAYNEEASELFDSMFWSKLNRVMIQTVHDSTETTSLCNLASYRMQNHTVEQRLINGTVEMNYEASAYMNANADAFVLFDNESTINIWWLFPKSSANNSEEAQHLDVGIKKMIASDRQYENEVAYDSALTTTNVAGDVEINVTVIAEVY